LENKDYLYSVVYEMNLEILWLKLRSNESNELEKQFVNKL